MGDQRKFSAGIQVPKDFQGSLSADHRQGVNVERNKFRVRFPIDPVFQRQSTLMPTYTKQG